jgi:hypothetical protein
MADEGNDCNAGNAFALAPRDLLETTIPQLCDQMWTAGYKSDATTLFDGYCRYVQRRYGAPVRTAAGVEAALAANTHELPLDPLFAPYFSGRLRSPADDAVADLIAVSRVGEAYSRDPIRGKRLRELSERASRLLPANVAGVSAKPAAKWTFEMTYDVQARKR